MPAFYMHLCHRMELRGLGKHLSCGTQAPVGRACRPHYHAFLHRHGTRKIFVGNARRKASQLDNHKIQPNTSRRRSRAFLHTGTVGNIGRRAVSCGAEQRSPFPEFQFSHSRKLRKRRFPLGHERSNGGGLCWNPFRSRSLWSSRPGLRHGEFPLFHFVKVKCIFLGVLGVYAILNLIKFLLTSKSKDYEGLFTSLASIIVFIIALKLNISQVPWYLALSLLIWIILLKKVIIIMIGRIECGL